ncbi:MAG: nucleotidyltransferase domain-containing protein [Candidatus Freyarchaeum deiterrae]
MKFGVESIPQGEYRRTVRRLTELLSARFGEKLVSIVIFGSVARGEARRESDIDVLVVCEDFEKSMRRTDKLVDIILQLWEEEKKAPEEQVWIEFYPLRPEEAEKNRPIYLDMIEDGVIILDRNGFMENVLKRLEKRLKELGSKKVYLPDGSWYWILKPTIEMGEILEI